MERVADQTARLAYLVAASDTSDDALLSLDLEGRLVSWNRGAQRLFGQGDRLVVGAPVAALVGDQDRPEFQRGLALANAGTPVVRLDISAKWRDGTIVPAKVSITPVRSDDGVVFGVSVVMRDVAELWLAQSTLADSAQRVAESEALAHVGSWAWDATTGAVQWSQEQHHIHGAAPQDFAGTLQAQLDRVHADDRAEVDRALQEAMRHAAPLDREFRIVRPDGVVRWVYAHTRLVVGPEGQGLGLRGIYQDITDRHESARVLLEANERLTRLALYDRLTGLPNRVLLTERLGHSLARSRQREARFDLMCLGVDDFRIINDSAGHAAGDQVLTALAPLLGQAVRHAGLPQRSPGRMLARLGGDEFAIVMDEGDPRVLAECIHELLQQPLQLPDDQVFISVSVGNVQVGPARTDVTPEVLLTEANIAMHEAKRGGKARFVSFEPHMHEAARRRHRLGHELHRALAEDEFVVHYQPVVDLTSGQVIGAEALVRWQHPTRGLVGPDNFISRAEETGLIVPLGAWVLRQACVEAVTWQRETGRALTVAVNVSGRQLREPDFAMTVRATLEETGLSPALLCLEMTESILMERDDDGLDMLLALRQEGVHLAIDDFGTGYSSLAALRRLPVDQLKIDRSFVAGLPADEDAATIVWAIVHLGHTLGLKVLAEGVETAEQRADLLRFGCDEGQGFLFGRGIPAREMAHLVHTGTGFVHQQL